ncbi:guanylate-binding protein 3-like [Pelodytes ibericus]
MDPDIQMAQPMCLIQNQDCDNLVIDEDAVKILHGISQPVVVVAIVGKYRTGKSYLMNKLAGKHDGFALGNTVQSKTKGIWMWCMPHPLKPKHTLVLLDTEGLGDVEKGDSQNDAWIFSLAVLLSSTLVFNSVGTIDQHSMETLHYVTELTERIKCKSAPETADADESAEFKRFFPNFIWCVRDFCLKLEKDNKKITEDEYLQDALKLKHGMAKKISEYNLPRECISHYFRSHKCFLLPSPTSGSDLRRLEELTEDQLDAKFVEQANAFCSFVFKTSEPKTLPGRLTVTGTMLGTLLKSYVGSIQSGSVPCMENAVMTLTAIENTAAIRDGVASYEDEMTQGAKEFPTEQDEFMNLHSDCEKRAVEVFMKRSFKDDQRKYQAQLMSELNQKFERFSKYNEQASTTKCRAIIKDLSTSLEQRLINGDFCKPGGHVEFVKEKQRLVDDYKKANGKGIKAKEILKEFLEEKHSVEKSILHSDKCLSEREKEMKERMIQKEAQDRQLELEYENKERLEKIIKEQERNFEKQTLMLRKKLEDERVKMLEENEWLIKQKEKEMQLLREQGFPSKADMVQGQVNDLQDQNTTFSNSNSVMDGILTLAELASLLLPGVFGKAAMVVANLFRKV